MPFNPFGDADGSSLERGDPVTQGVKQATKALTGQAAQQAQAAKQSFIDQLYGNVSTADPETDQTGETGSTQQNPQQKAQAAASAMGGGKTPSEQSQLDDARRRLQELQEGHKKTYYEATFGEEAQRKRQQREEEERQMKLQEEEEEAQRKAQEKAQQDDSLQSFMPAGKGQGRNRMSAPIAVTQAKTKTEINRGASG